MPKNEEIELRWYAVLPQAKIVYGDEIWDFSDPADFGALARNVKKELKIFKPLVLQGHDESSVPLGRVITSRVLSKEEAHKRGILDQKSPNMLYLGVVESTPGSLLGHEYASVTLTSEMIDEDGKMWPWWIDELSTTPTPHIRKEQALSSSIKMKARFVKTTKKSKKLRLSARFSASTQKRVKMEQEQKLTTEEEIEIVESVVDDVIEEVAEQKENLEEFALEESEDEEEVTVVVADAEELIDELELEDFGDEMIGSVTLDSLNAKLDAKFDVLIGMVEALAAGGTKSISDAIAIEAISGLDASEKDVLKVLAAGMHKSRTKLLFKAFAKKASSNRRRKKAPVLRMKTSKSRKAKRGNSKKLSRNGLARAAFKVQRTLAAKGKSVSYEEAFQLVRSR